MVFLNEKCKRVTFCRINSRKGRWHQRCPVLSMGSSMNQLRCPPLERNVEIRMSDDCLHCFFLKPRWVQSCWLAEDCEDESKWKGSMIQKTNKSLWSATLTKTSAHRVLQIPVTDSWRCYAICSDHAMTICERGLYFVCSETSSHVWCLLY